MIGNYLTDKDGNPINSSGQKLSKSAYQPSAEVKKLWVMVQRDYQTAYMLQHRPFKEFDGYSLLNRSKLDQETFAAFVGVEYQPQHKRWRWRGRKHTARNKLIGILAHMLAGMLYPFVEAKNEANEDDKMTARVMRILIEDHLKRADYEVKFMFMVLTALVNPAVFVEVEWVEATQRIKQQLKDGTVKVVEVVDEILSGLNLNIVPIDELMLTDFYSGTGKLSPLPCVLRVRRISYDEARAKYSGKYYDEQGEDLFRFVEAGRTRIVLTGNENQELFDIEWTEADRNYVQEITAYYRGEDLEVKFVGGVFMGNEKNVFNTNPFTHRRLTIQDGEYLTIPVLPFVMSGFEPLDPTGRFAYYKSGAFKEFWDDQALNQMHRLAYDGTYLDVFKVIFASGVGKVDSTVMVPGNVVGMPAGAVVSPYQLGPNLKAAFEMIQREEQDMSNSTQDQIMQGTQEANTTATQTVNAIQQAKVFMGVFSIHIADLIEKIGELVKDEIINHATVGELDDSIPSELNMKYKQFLIKGKEKGKNITHKIEFTTKHMGKKYTQDKINEKELELYKKSGKNWKERYTSDQRIYEVNPYQFAITSFTIDVDADKILDKSLGATKDRKMTAFNVLSDPRIAPFTDQEAVSFDVIEEFGQDLSDDPEKFKKKMQLPSQNPMMDAMIGQGQNQNPGSFKLGGGVVTPSQQNQTPLPI